MMKGLGLPPVKTYVEDVFSAYAYTGNATLRSITNGIDLSGMGGIAWVKDRNGVNPHLLLDTERGNNSVMSSNNTSAESLGWSSVFQFLGNGIQLSGGSNFNASGTAYIGWFFRKASKFLDIVKYTGDGTAQQILNHSLGIKPGFIIVKRVDAAGAWMVQARMDVSTSVFLQLNAVDTPPTAWSGESLGLGGQSTFSVGSGGTNDLNINGARYVSYVFAHDDSVDGMIQCGKFANDGSGNATVTLGWEPQFVLLKNVGAVENWYVLDSMRGMPSGSTDIYLSTNLSNAEGSLDMLDPTSTGFKIKGLNASQTYIYIAIRRPNKPPTSGTQVYQSMALPDGTVSVPGMEFADLAINTRRSTSFGRRFADRLRGIGKDGSSGLYLDSTSANPEVTYTATSSVSLASDNVFCLIDNSLCATLGGSNGGVAHFFRRAPGFFDEVCYTGSTVNQAVKHNLTVVPELMIIKNRNVAGGSYPWPVFHKDFPIDQNVYLNTTAVMGTQSLMFTNPEANYFYTTPNSWVGYDGSSAYVAYLFASLPGISKVGKYTGNGTSQTINCWFSAGARFVLIKRTDAISYWFLWDSARGIVAGNDPRLALNNTSAEGLADDVDPDASGFIVNQINGIDVNVNGGTYIFLAIA